MSEFRGRQVTETKHEIIRFRLKGDLEDLEPEEGEEDPPVGRKASAAMLIFVDGSLEEADFEIDVYDAFGNLDGSDGDEGYARYFADADRYEIITLDC